MTNNLPRKDMKLEATLEELEQQLEECEANEDYEQAAEIMKRINQLKNK